MSNSPPRVAIVGGGPAGLMAAEVLSQSGIHVDLYDAMPSVGRKFLLAGKGGLNLTHSEPTAAFISRYGARAGAVAGWLQDFGPQHLRDWAAALGIETYVGTSGRVFPRDMKAAPLLRAWLQRLRQAGVQLHMRHQWDGGLTRMQPPQPALQLKMATPVGTQDVQADAVVLALGGASWPQLGSNGAWWPWLASQQVDLAPLQPANCGFDVGWSDFFAQRHAGAPIKSVRLRFDAGDEQAFDRQGEFVITATGVEGSLIYAASALIRDHIAAHGSATVQLDLVPGRDADRLADALARGRGARSLGNHLREHAGIEGAKAALLRESLSNAEITNLLARDPAGLAQRLKAWPLILRAARPVAEAISTAGGVRLEAMDERLMLRALPGVFCAGEMLDWEAPTGGYLLTACFASGRAAALGVLDWAASRPC